MYRVWRSLIAVAVLVIPAGCAVDSLNRVVPASLSDSAQVARMPDVRLWGDGNARPVALIEADRSQLIAKYRERIRSGGSATSHLLAISGGADDGAFGAGVLAGWGARGDRPEFDLVTGISAGALVAPLVFVGKEMDGKLAEVFVKHGGEDIYQAKVLAGLFGGPSVADNAPLARLIETYVDGRLLRRVAEERSKGRFLLVGTTNLAAQRPVFWDMGRIAQQGDGRALELFRKVLLASAALPGIFPPVSIDVTADGKIYREVHVDGGPTREVFLSPIDFSFKTIDTAIGKKVQRRLYVIRNGKVSPEYALVPETALAISMRAIETLTKNQGIGDLIRMYERARADGIDYNLAVIPADFSAPRPAPFDRNYMKALYDKGYALGRSGFQWEKVPPGIAAATR